MNLLLYYCAVCIFYPYVWISQPYIYKQYKCYRARQKVSYITLQWMLILFYFFKKYIDLYLPCANYFNALFCCIIISLSVICKAL